MPVKSLKSVMSDAEPPYTELTMRLLFCTTLVAGSCSYRFREIEIYSEDDPYTHRGDEQVATCGGWYFHRTRPGGGWKGGTFMGMDISFAPVGTAGGILIRGLSRCDNDDGRNNSNNNNNNEYFDGSCNCVRELLRACGVTKICDLVANPGFELDALTENGIMRLVEHEPRAVPNPADPSDCPTTMEWKASSRVGLSEPAKRPDQLEGRKKYHLAPLRFLSAPYETKKEKRKIATSETGGIFTMDEFKKFDEAEDTKMPGPFGGEDSDSDYEPLPKKHKISKKMEDADMSNPFAEDDSDSDSKPEPKKSKTLKKIEDADATDPFDEDGIGEYGSDDDSETEPKKSKHGKIPRLKKLKKHRDIEKGVINGEPKPKKFKTDRERKKTGIAVIAELFADSDTNEPEPKKIETDGEKKQTGKSGDSDQKALTIAELFGDSDSSTNSTNEPEPKKIEAGGEKKQTGKSGASDRKKRAAAIFADTDSDASTSSTNEPGKATSSIVGPSGIRPLKSVFSSAEAPYTELAMRLLFCTTLHAGSCCYRLRDIEIFSGNDPYTQGRDEQITTCGGWYFHRTKPGGGWKGGTFMGLDISFAPVGTAGGILLRGISRYSTVPWDDGYKYFDGPCNCVRELLRACDETKIGDLVANPTFRQDDAFAENGIMRLVEHPPIAVVVPGANPSMEWTATSRVGLGAPAKDPDRLEARQKYHLAPLRFLAGPYETKKEKTKITNAKTSGIFTTEQFEKFKTNVKTLKDLDGSDSDSSDSDYEASDNSHESNGTMDERGVWHYWLDQSMDGKHRGWHGFDKAACAKLEAFLEKGEHPPKKFCPKRGAFIQRGWHLQSGHFSYEVDLNNMTQRNTKSGTIRPIRRVLPGDVFSTSEPPIGENLPEHSPKIKIKIEKKIPSLAKHEAPLADTKSNKSKKEEEEEEGKTNLKLEPLFAGQHGYAWEGPLTEVLETLPRAAEFIGPDRNKDILPVRELTFRALMALPPEHNNLVVFGQAPYPRVESASGIAMFDSLIKDWDCAQFGKTVSMRCIAKTAAVAKGLVPQNAKIAELRKAFSSGNVVSPPEWFQAMLAQGVLLLNASLTIGVLSTAQHTKFWMPVMNCIVEEILRSKRDKFPPGTPQRRIGFLWWGNEALKTKKSLLPVLAKYEEEVEITHIEHFNPAAQGDKFSQPPNHFRAVNDALAEGSLDAINWLPDKAWLAEHHVDEHAAFITETQELHKFYLDRLQAGLDTTDLEPIVGIMASELCSLPDACDPLGLRSTAFMALSTVGDKEAGSGLNKHEKGAVYLYTTNVLYRRLNEALRNPDRSKVVVYFEYLRVFLEAHGKMAKARQEPRKTLYRGINKDLGELYKTGSRVTWWTVSSCTPNISVAEAFGGGSPTGTLFHVESKTAVPIMHLSAYESEEEYVLAPGTVLHVDKIVAKPGRATQIYLEEVEGKRHVH